MSRTPFDTDVAIIGYGPSGVSAALCLGQYGINAVAFERDSAIYPRARAVTVNDWTMRCFQSVGLDEALARDMDRTVALRWVTYDGHQLMRLEFPPSDLGEHPVSYAIYQPVMEETLRRGVQRHADLIDVRYRQEVTGIEQDGDGVTIRSRDLQSGAEQTTRARYALACDGGGSVTRERLGIKLIGETVDTRWLVVDAGAITRIDYSAGGALRELREDLAKHGVVLALTRVSASLREDLDRQELTEAIGAGRIFGSRRDCLAAYESQGLSNNLPPKT